jgi:hypothetical protein
LIFSLTDKFFLYLRVAYLLAHPPSTLRINKN